jgi:drug/metabolite transporter (DMT)-like permease
MVWPLYGVLVVIWSSTWVAIKIGLEDTPPLLGAGLRFALAGLALLVVASAWGRGRASARARLRTDPLLAGTLALLPFATAYGLIYWGEQYVPSGLAAVLFGVLPLYSAALVAVALREEPLSRRLLIGITVAIGGVALAFSESVELGDARWAAPAAVACALAPMAAAVGTIAQKRRGARLDAVALNGWAMLGGGGLLLAASALSEDWARAAWSAASVGSIAYLAAFGSAVGFVLLSLLIRELPAVTMSCIALVLPFGALAFGAAIYDEAVTLPAVAGAALVAGGLALSQWPARRAAAAGVSGRRSG